MNPYDDERALVEAMFAHAQELQVERPGSRVASLPEVQHTELSAACTDEPLATEWNVYRREIGRWLAEGLGGKHVLLKGDDIVGFFESWGAAREAGLRRFLREPFFVHPIRATEPYVRIRGINHPCPSSTSRSAAPA